MYVHIILCMYTYVYIYIYIYIFGRSTNGPHDFNREPLAPPGTKVMVHKKPQVRTSWGFHGQIGWYVGPAYKHY